MNLQQTEQIVLKLNPKRIDDRDQWVQVGLNIFTIDSGRDGKDLYERYSRRSPNYRIGQCSKVWKGFAAAGKPQQTLEEIAAEDGVTPESPKNGVAKEKKHAQRPATAKTQSQASKPSGKINPDDIETAKSYNIRDLWIRLDLGELPTHGNVSSPWRRDSAPSVQVGGERNIVYDHGLNETIDTIELVRKVKGTDFPAAVEEILSLMGKRPRRISAPTPARSEHGPKKDAESVTAPGPQTAPELPRNKTGAPEQHKTRWKSLKEAQEQVATMPEAIESAVAVNVLKTDYGLDLAGIPEGWRFADLTGKGPGIVYPGRSPGGDIAFKFKSFERKAGKRSCEFLFQQNGSAPAAIHLPHAYGSFCIVGGEEKSAALNAAGFETLCLLTGEGRLHPEWAKWVADRQPRKVIVCNDNDGAGDRANQGTIEALIEAGCPRLIIHKIQWPENLPEGYDINNLIKDGVDLFDFVESANAVEPMMSFDGVREIFEYEDDPNDCLLGDYLLSKGGACALIGPGGIGKSRIVLQLSINMVLGLEWCGFKTNGQGLRWVFIQNENSPRRLKMDLGRMLKGWHKEQIDLIHDRVKILVPRTEIDRHIGLDDDQTVVRLRENMRALQPDIVVFDPLVEVFAGDNENDSMQMRETLRMIYAVTRAAKPEAVPIIIHHSRIGRAAALGAQTMERGAYGRGSKALFSSVRTQINLAPGGDEENAPLILSIGKNNDGRIPPRRAVQLDENSWCYEVIDDFDWEEYDDILTHQPGKVGRKSVIDGTDIMARLSFDSEIRQAELTKELAENHGVGKSSVNRKIIELVKNGNIMRREETRGNLKFYLIKRGK